MGRLTNPTAKQKRDMLDRRYSAHTRSHGHCEACGTPDDLTDSHIIGRAYMKARFDPRNNQCICFSCHGKYEMQPIAFAKFVNTTTCGQYVDVMTIQANALPKPDYDLWFKIWDIIKERNYTLEQSRVWLGQNIMLYELDILKLD